MTKLIFIHAASEGDWYIDYIFETVVVKKLITVCHLQCIMTKLIFIHAASEGDWYIDYIFETEVVKK